MSFGENIKNSFKILLFNETSLLEISNNEKATGYGLWTLIIAGIAMVLSQFSIEVIRYPRLLFGFIISLIFTPLFLILGLFIGYSIFHFIAKFILHGQATGIQYFRSLSNSFVIYWITFIPNINIFLRIIAGIWLMIINIFILHKVHKLSKGDAIIIGLLPLILGLIIIIPQIFSNMRVIP